MFCNLEMAKAGAAGGPWVVGKGRGCDLGHLEGRQESILRRIFTLDERLCTSQLCQSSSPSLGTVNFSSLPSPPLVTGTAAIIPIRRGIPGATVSGGKDLGLGFMVRPLSPLKNISRSFPDRVSSRESEFGDLESRQESISQRISKLNDDLRVVVESQDVRISNGSPEAQDAAQLLSEFDEGRLSSDNTGREFQAKEQNGFVSKSEASRCSDSRNGIINLGGSGLSQQGGPGAVSSSGDGAEQRLTSILKKAGATFEFRRAPPDYYERSFEARREILGAASVDHLCKSIVMVNTQAQEAVVDCSDRKNSKYYVVVVQYTARLNAEKVKNFLYTLNNGAIPRKRFNMRLAPEEVSSDLTGFQHNAVTPFGMKTEIPVIFSCHIEALKPAFFWLGGGEVDLKLGIKTEDFLRIVNPLVANCVY